MALTGGTREKSKYPKKPAKNGVCQTGGDALNLFFFRQICKFFGTEGVQYTGNRVVDQDLRYFYNLERHK